LTEVEPADTVFGEMFDALVALWAVTVSALIIGFVGAMGFSAQIAIYFERGERMKKSKENVEMTARNDIVV